MKNFRHLQIKKSSNPPSISIPIKAEIFSSSQSIPIKAEIFSPSQSIKIATNESPIQIRCRLLQACRTLSTMFKQLTTAELILRISYQELVTEVVLLLST